MPNRARPRRIAFQGQAGAYSDLACREAYPGLRTLPCPGFEDLIDAVRLGQADLGMIPIENSVAGRVAEIRDTWCSIVLLGHNDVVSNIPNRDRISAQREDRSRWR